MVPPQQSLYSPHLASTDGEDRLVADDELAFFHGPPQVVLQLQPSERSGVHGWIEHLEAPALILSPVHGGVRVPEEILGAPGSGVTQGDTDAGRGVQFPTIQHEWPPELHRDPLGHPARLSGAIDVRYQHDELVATEASEDVFRTQAQPQASGHRHQEPVAHLVPQGIVYRLEVIQICKQYGDLATGSSPCVHEGLPEPIYEELAV